VGAGLQILRSGVGAGLQILRSGVTNPAQRDYLLSNVENDFWNIDCEL